MAGLSCDTLANNALAVARLNTDSSSDNTFDTGGTVRASMTGGGIIDEAKSIALLPDGRILMGGFSYQTFSANGLTVATAPTMGLLDSMPTRA